MGLSNMILSKPTQVGHLEVIHVVPRSTSDSLSRYLINTHWSAQVPSSVLASPCFHPSSTLVQVRVVSVLVLPALEDSDRWGSSWLLPWETKLLQSQQTQQKKKNVKNSVPNISFYQQMKNQEKQVPGV